MIVLCNEIAALLEMGRSDISMLLGDLLLHWVPLFFSQIYSNFSVLFSIYM